MDLLEVSSFDSILDDLLDWFFFGITSGRVAAAQNLTTERHLLSLIP